MIHDGLKSAHLEHGIFPLRSSDNKPISPISLHFYESKREGIFIIDMTGIILNFLWPRIKDEKCARMAGRQGLIVMALFMALSFAPILSHPINGENLFDLLGILINTPFFLIPGIAIYFCFRAGSVMLLLGLLSMDVFVFSMAIDSPGFNLTPSSPGSLMNIILWLAVHLLLYLFTINSLRGTFALSTMKKNMTLKG